MKKCFLILAMVLLIAALQGCSSGCKNVPNSPLTTIFDPNQPVHIVVSTTPYEVKQSTLDSLQSFYKDMLGLETKISKVDLGVTRNSELTKEYLFEASQETFRHAKCPTVLVITVDHVENFKGYGYCLPELEVIYENGEQYPVALVVLVRKNIFVEYFESTLLKHEIGHWVGIPSRDCHLHKDNSHCTSCRCLMMPGPGSDPLRWWLGGVGLSILFLSPPDYCNDCKEELIEMKKLHLQANQILLAK